MKTKPKRIVIDTNIIVAALRSRRGASNKLMQLIGTKKFIPCLSVGLILEYEEVLLREFPKLEKAKIKQLLDYLCLASEHTRIHFSWRPSLKDPDDDMLLELAVAAEAEYIITYNGSDFKGLNKFEPKAIPPKELLELIGELS
jgi:putative PIN family toxin of toxin-antitoxin system